MLSVLSSFLISFSLLFPTDLPSPELIFVNLCFFFHSALSEEEKTSLRAGLITNFNEPINQVSGK